MILKKAARNTAITAICILLGVMIAWQYKSINDNQKTTNYENSRKEELMVELIRLQKNNAELSERLQQLKLENEQYKQAGNSDNLNEILMKELDKANIFAGLVPVKGKGLLITIDNGDFFSVQDDDLLALVNELRAADAQAVSINEERIVAMTEIRYVSSSYIMVNGTQVVAPFVFKAIGDMDKMEHSLKMVGGVIEELESYEFKITLEKLDNIVIPAVRDDGSVIRTNYLTPYDE